MEVNIVFISGTRSAFPSLNDSKYSPHIVLRGTNELIPVTFVRSEIDCFGVEGSAIIKILYNQFHYKHLKIGSSFDIKEGNHTVGYGVIKSFDDTTIDPLFSNVQKGIVAKTDFINWNLGNVILRFLDNNYEFMVFCLVKKKIFKKEKYCEITHLHIDKEDIKSFIDKIDDPNNKIEIKNLLFGVSFQIVDKNKPEKHGYYSE